MDNYKFFKKLIKEFTPEKVIFPVYEDIRLNLDPINIQDERWKDIEGFNYLISNYGRVKNKNTGNIKSLRNGKYGYQINLWNNGKEKMFTISRLVANYFIREVKQNERVCHKDKNIINNYYKNLEIIRR